MTLCNNLSRKRGRGWAYFRETRYKLPSYEFISFLQHSGVSVEGEGGMVLLHCHKLQYSASVFRLLHHLSPQCS